MRYGWIALFLLSGLVAFSQNSARVKQLENQRKKALEEIEMTSQLLNETKISTRSSLNRLNLLSKQILSRKKSYKYSESGDRRDRFPNKWNAPGNRSS